MASGESISTVPGAHYLYANANEQVGFCQSQRNSLKPGNFHRSLTLSTAVFARDWYKLDVLRAYVIGENGAFVCLGPLHATPGRQRRWARSIGGCNSEMGGNSLNTGISRRRFLRQSFAFSALVGLGALPAVSISYGSDSESADLLMVGDWGADDDFSAQSSVAAGMRRYAENRHLKSQALFMLGDNWYGDLAGGAQSPRWRTQFEEMYPAAAFPCPVYAVLGNHDYQMGPMNKVDAELEYAESGQSRFTMPSRWYSFEFPAKHPLITFLALDSNVPEGDGVGGRKPGVDRRGFVVMTPEQNAEQLSWLGTEFEKSRATPFLAVLAHHPIYSDGPHGDHATLIRDWDPLFQKYGVHLYLAGHDHDLQHLEFEGHPTSFFLSGGGGADLYNLKIDSSQRGPYAQKVYGFSHLSVTRERMTLRHIDSEGRVLHAFTKTPDGKVSIPIEQGDLELPEGIVISG